MTRPGHDPNIYLAQPRSGPGPILCFVGGAAAFGLALLLLVGQLLIPPENQAAFPFFIASTVIPSLFGFAAIGYGWMLLNQVTEVELGPDGMTVVSDRGEREIFWADIERADTDKIEYPMFGIEMDALRVVGRGGRKLATLTDRLGRFPELADRVATEATRRTGEPRGHARGRREQADGRVLRRDGAVPSNGRCVRRLGHLYR